MDESILELHGLSFVPEGDEVVIGRIDTGSYAVFPADGAELLRRLSEGMPLSQAATWYLDTFGEPVDVEDFAASLNELGFVRQQAEHQGPNRPVRFRSLGLALFSLPAWLLYVLVAAAWAVAVTHDSALWPRPSQIFFTWSLLAVQVVITFGQIPLLYLHEVFHILAGRRLGLPSRMRVSNRLTYVVFETEMNGLMSVPRRARYLPFLAGMLCDAVVFCLLDLTAELTRTASGVFSLAGRICLVLAFTVFVRMAWQFQLYLRTDLYYVFASFLNCYDLHDASTALLRNRIWRALRRQHRLVDEQQWTERDRKVGLFYGPFIVLGIIVFILITEFVSLPVTREYFATEIRSLTAGGFGFRFWDAALSLSFNVAQIVVLLVVSRRKRRMLTGRGPRLLTGKAD